MIRDRIEDVTRSRRFNSCVPCATCRAELPSLVAKDIELPLPFGRLLGPIMLMEAKNLPRKTPVGLELGPFRMDCRPTVHNPPFSSSCLLYTSDAADEE